MSEIFFFLVILSMTFPVITVKLYKYSNLNLVIINSKSCVLELSKLSFITYFSLQRGFGVGVLGFWGFGVLEH